MLCGSVDLPRKRRSCSSFFLVSSSSDVTLMSMPRFVPGVAFSGGLSSVLILSCSFPSFNVFRQSQVSFHTRPGEVVPEVNLRHGVEAGR